ncbi:MAG TPA: hypothetical protein ENI29_14670 [bacterium]|nr:hypothetical protein [bacterium]
MVTITIKRENFKGKFFNVARMGGRFVAVRRWSPTTFNLNQARRLFKKNMTHHAITFLAFLILFLNFSDCFHILLLNLGI